MKLNLNELDIVLGTRYELQKGIRLMGGSSPAAVKRALATARAIARRRKDLVVWHLRNSGHGLYAPCICVQVPPHSPCGACKRIK